MKGITHEPDHTPIGNCNRDRLRPAPVSDHSTKPEEAPASSQRLQQADEESGGLVTRRAVGEPGAGIAGDGRDVAGDDDGSDFERTDLVEEPTTDGTVFCFGEDGDFGCTRPAKRAARCEATDETDETDEVGEEATWASSEVLWQGWFECDAAREDLCDPGDASGADRGPDATAEGLEGQAGS